MSKAWSYAEREGLTYEYVNEFAISKERGFCGLSIALRNEFEELFKSFLSSDKYNKNNSIGRAIQKLNNKYNGFEFSCSEVGK